jgi:threonine/homoserine/homoserine lactone efflux protein
MEIFIQGFGIGLGLTIMVGPITLTIIDASLSDGWKAGIITAMSMWLSDLMYITGSYYGGKELVDRITMESMDVWLSLGAGFILLTIGIVLWSLRNKKIDLSKNAPSFGHGISHFFRGFLVNTFSPFTLLFWPTIIITIVFAEEMPMSKSTVFFAAIMLAIMTGDTLKATFAGWIRQRISPQYMRYTRSLIAGLFVAGGIYMGVKGLAGIGAL